MELRRRPTLGAEFWGQSSEEPVALLSYLEEAEACRDCGSV